MYYLLKEKRIINLLQNILNKLPILQNKNIQNKNCFLSIPEGACTDSVIKREQITNTSSALIVNPQHSTGNVAFVW